MGKLDKVDLNKLSHGNHSDGQGLFLQVRGNSRSWVLRYSMMGKDRNLGLGSLRDITLKQARLNAGAKRKEVDAARKGERGAIDPIDSRREVRAEMEAKQRLGKTFKQAATDYISLNESKWTNDKHRWQWSNTLKLYVYPTFGSKPAALVDRQDVLAALKPIWKKYPKTARSVRSRIETVIDFAQANGWRPDNLANPALQRPIHHALGDQSATVRKQPALPYEQMMKFMADLRDCGGFAARGLEFQILTATRGREAMEAEWSEVDWKAKTWTVPWTRLKSNKKDRRDHVVPLSTAALALLRRLFERRHGDAIFGVCVTATEMVIKRMNAARAIAGLPLYLDPDQDNRPVVPHGVARATFRTWVSEATDFSAELAEKALAHQVGGETERSYNRALLLEKRRKLMEAWGSYCSSKGAPVQAAA